MKLDRREFLMLTAGFVTGCETGGNTGANQERTVAAGPAGDYAADGVYNNFRDQGFFVVRQGEKLFALSAICTHRKCKLASVPDHSFYCKCHGSTFDPGGHVTKGPAKRDLPVLTSFTDEQGRLMVKVSIW